MRKVKFLPKYRSSENSDADWFYEILLKMSSVT